MTLVFIKNKIQYIAHRERLAGVGVCPVLNAYSHS